MRLSRLSPPWARMLSPQHAHLAACTRSRKLVTRKSTRRAGGSMYATRCTLFTPNRFQTGDYKVRHRFSTVYAGYGPPLTQPQPGPHRHAPVSLGAWCPVGMHEPRQPGWCHRSAITLLECSLDLLLAFVSTCVSVSRQVSTLTTRVDSTTKQELYSAAGLPTCTSRRPKNRTFPGVAALRHPVEGWTVNGNWRLARKHVA